MHQKYRGFSLIELLVVITILAILSVVGIATFSGIQKNARNVRRISDLREVQKALERYHAINDRYPDTNSMPDNWTSECGGWTPVNSNVIPGIVPNYLREVPRPPAFNSGTWDDCYWYTSDGVNYKFGAWASENTTQDYLKYPAFVDPQYDGGPSGTGSNPTSCNGAGDGTDVSRWFVHTYTWRCDG